MASTEFWGYWHGLRWHNMCFYLNPFTLKLEPIGFDSTSWIDDSLGSVFRHPQLILAKKLVVDGAVFAAYRHHLSRFLTEDSRRQTVDTIAPLEQDYLAQLSTEIDLPTVDVERRIQQRMQVLGTGRPPIPGQQEIAAGAVTGHERVGQPSNAPFVVAVYADVVRSSDGRAHLELVTGLKEDVEVTHLFVGSGLHRRPLSVELPIRLQANFFDHAPRVVRIPLPSDLKTAPGGISGKATVVARPPREGPTFRYSRPSKKPESTTPPSCAAPPEGARRNASAKLQINDMDRRGRPRGESVVLMTTYSGSKRTRDIPHRSAVPAGSGP